jgi:hypothetical protein
MGKNPFILEVCIHHLNLSPRYFSVVMPLHLSKHLVGERAIQDGYSFALLRFTNRPSEPLVKAPKQAFF